jgi:hypothetical protein
MPIVAYYWNGGAPQGHPVTNLTESGAHLATADRWYPGTVVRLSLRREAQTISVRGRVTENNGDGVELRFVWLSRQERRAFRDFLRGRS